MGRPTRVDLALAGTIAVAAQVESWAHSTAGPLAALASAGLALVATLSLAWRVASPMWSAIAALSALAALAAADLLDQAWVYPVLLLASYSAARHAPPRRSVVVLILALGVTAIANVYETWGGWLLFLGNFSFVALLVVCVPWAAGFALRRRQVLALEAAHVAVGDERRRIARELHDVVGHALGVMVVQAGAERVTLPPDAAASTRDTLLTIEQTGRQALTEMRRLLEVMRAQDHASADRAPQPGLDQVETLVRNVRAAGLRVDLRVEGEPVPLPPGLDLSAYRIVQEALTNAVRHAGPAQAEVTIRHLEGAVELEIVDDGIGPGRRPGTGFGLTGIRERAALFNGTASTGARAEGGYAVRVHLPIDSRDP